MICYVCSGPASMECRICHRYVCTEHTIEYGSNSFYCNSCIDLFEKRQVANEKAIQEKLKKSMWCDFCGFPVDYNSCLPCAPVPSGPDAAHNPDCYICKRRYCKKHGQVLVVNNDYYWFRCIDHLKKPGILGLHKKYPFFGLFMGKADYYSPNPAE